MVGLLRITSQLTAWKVKGKKNTIWKSVWSSEHLPDPAFKIENTPAELHAAVCTYFHIKSKEIYCAFSFLAPGREAFFPRKLLFYSFYHFWTFFHAKYIFMLIRLEINFTCCQGLELVPQRDWNGGGKARAYAKYFVEGY